MADENWSAKVRPELHPAAQMLVNIYEATPGSTGPGCCPEALAAVLEHLLETQTQCFSEWQGVMHQHFFYLKVSTVANAAALLRGEQP
jgi:hypothetical protein